MLPMLFALVPRAVLTRIAILGLNEIARRVETPGEWDDALIEAAASIVGVKLPPKDEPKDQQDEAS